MAALSLSAIGLYEGSMQLSCSFYPPTTNKFLKMLYNTLTASFLLASVTSTFAAPTGGQGLSGTAEYVPMSDFDFQSLVRYRHKVINAGNVNLHVAGRTLHSNRSGSSYTFSVPDLRNLVPRTFRTLVSLRQIRNY